MVTMLTSDGPFCSANLGAGTRNYDYIAQIMTLSNAGREAILAQ